MLKYIVLRYIPDPSSSLHGCSNSRKTSNLAFFKILKVKRSDSSFIKKRKLCTGAGSINALIKTRVLDANILRQTDENIHICEICFKDITIGRKIQSLFLLACYSGGYLIKLISVCNFNKFCFLRFYSSIMYLSPVTVEVPN